MKYFQKTITVNMQEALASLLCCSTCLTKVKSAKSLTQHKCSIQLCLPQEKPDLEVRSNSQAERMTGAFLHYRDSMHNILTFSYVTGTALPKIAPLFFTNKWSPPILGSLGCVEDSYDRLRDAACEAPVKLWKSLKIKSGDSVLLITRDLIPSSPYQLKRRKLKMVDKQDHVMIYHVSQVSNEL